MRQSLDILQSTALELRQLLRQELETNPALEDESEPLSLEEKESEAAGSDAELGQFSDYEDAYREEMILAGRTLGRNREREELREHLYDSLQSPRTLHDHILEQARGTEISPEVLDGLRVLLGSLDERGFLRDDPEELALNFGMRMDDMNAARMVLSGLEPIGLGARDLRECLLFQLRAQGREGSLAWRIVHDHLDALARNKRPEIAKALGVTVADVNAATSQIAALDPNPARDFADDDNRCVNPDVRIHEDEAGQWHVELNNDDLPRLRISNHYKDMLSNPATRNDARSFIRDKIRGGKFIIQCIEQRQDTLRKIAHIILDRQQEYFLHGPAHLKPLTMQQVAEGVGVHETTVSRAIAGKFVETPFGVVEMRKFFTTGYQTASGEDVANSSVKDKIAAMIAEEDPQHPLSDSTIVSTLEKEGLEIARRTVAKYRDALGIPPSHLRRQHA